MKIIMSYLHEDEKLRECLESLEKFSPEIEIIKIKEPEASATGPLGIVDFQGSRVEASLAMTPNAGVGDWVLINAGFAIVQLDDEEARATFETIAEAMIDNGSRNS